MLLKNKNFQIVFFSFIVPFVIYFFMSKLNMLLANPKMSDYWELGDYIYNFWTIDGFGYTVRTYPASLYQAILRLIVGGDIYYALILQTFIYSISLFFFIKTYFNLLPKWSFLLIGSSPLILYILNSYNAEPLQITLFLLILSLGKRYLDTKDIKYFVIMLLLGSIIYSATSRVLFLPLLTISIFYFYVNRFNLLKTTIIIFLFIGVGEVIKIPSYINNYGETPNYTLSSNLKWGIWAGSIEYSNFPYSVELNKKIFEEHPGAWNELDTDYIQLAIDNFLENPMSVIRNYIFKLYRVWVPMQTYEGGSKSLGVILSIIYGTIIFVLFIFGIYLSYRYEKNRWIFWVMFIPMLFHWAQHTILITYSGYMSIARFAQLYFAGFAVMFLLNRFLYKNLFNLDK